jgi:hypothetical protein
MTQDELTRRIQEKLARARKKRADKLVEINSRHTAA